MTSTQPSNMTGEIGKSTVALYSVAEDIPGFMFVSGYVMAFHPDGMRMILSAKGGGGKFIMANKNECYVNGNRFYSRSSLCSFFSKGDTLCLFIRDLGEARLMGTFRVRYHAILSWCGKMPHVPPVVPNSFFLNLTCAKENRLPTAGAYEISSDVPIKNLTLMSGYVYWCCESYGLVSVNPKPGIFINVLFSSKDLYINGIKVPPHVKLPSICSADTFHLYSKKIASRNVFGVTVKNEAVLVWKYHKPWIRLNYIPQTKDEFVQRSVLHQTNRPDILENGAASATSVEPKIDDHSEESTSKPLCTYLTGQYKGECQGYFVYGNTDRAIRLPFQNFFAEGIKFTKSSQVKAYILAKCNEKCVYKPALIHSYATRLQEPLKIDGFNFVWESMFAWIGHAPEELKDVIKSLVKEGGVAVKSVEASNSISKTDEVVTEQDNLIKGLDPEVVTEQDNLIKDSGPEVMTDREDLIKGLDPISIARPLKRGMLSGFVIRAAAADAVLTGFSNCVYFTRERFYVNGKKFKGTSLLHFFQKKSEKVSTYLMPMQPDVKHGCIVTSKAVCAWVGDTPSELSKLLTYENKNWNREIDPTIHLKKKNSIYYFVGRVKKFGEKSGVIQCDGEIKDMFVGFTMADVYKHGIKVKEDSNVGEHTRILLTSRWSVLAYYSEEETIPGVNYYALAVFHHDNLAELFDEFHNKIPLWLKKLQNGGTCVCQSRLDKFLKKNFSVSLFGKVMEQNEDELAFGVKDQGLVWLPREKVWMDSCSCYFSKADERRLCRVVLGEDKEPLFAFAGKGSHLIECSQAGSPDTYEDSDQDSNEHNDEKYYQDVYEDESYESSSDDEANEDMVEVSDPYDLIGVALKNSYAPLAHPEKSQPAKVKKVKKISKRKDISGRHAIGKIVDISGDEAIISWHSNEYNGTIFVTLDVNYLYIDTIQYHKLDSSHILKQKHFKDNICNIYINTLSHPRMMGLLEVCGQATAGWIGVKPIFMPPPGNQKAGTFEASHLRIAYSQFEGAKLQFCSLTYWRKYLKEQEKQLQERALQEESKKAKVLKPSNSCLVKPSVKPKKASRSSLHKDISDRMSDIKLSEEQPMKSLALTNEQVLQSLCPSDQFASSDKPCEETPCEQQSTRTTTGKASIVEIHASLGKLVAADGQNHFFAPDQFYLHGVSLRRCELFCVLITGE